MQINVEMYKTELGYHIDLFMTKNGSLEKYLTINDMSLEFCMEEVYKAIKNGKDI